MKTYHRFSGYAYLDGGFLCLLLRLDVKKLYYFISILAELCWIEYHQIIKCAILPDLKHIMVIYELDRFSESHIYGIAIDKQEHILYFIVQTISKSILYSYNLISKHTTHQKEFARFKVILFLKNAF